MHVVSLFADYDYLNQQVMLAGRDHCVSSFLFFFGCVSGKKAEAAGRCFFRDTFLCTSLSLCLAGTVTRSGWGLFWAFRYFEPHSTIDKSMLPAVTFMPAAPAVYYGEAQSRADCMCIFAFSEAHAVEMKKNPNSPTAPIVVIG